MICVVLNCVPSFLPSSLLACMYVSVILLWVKSYADDVVIYVDVKLLDDSSLLECRGYG
jgi:hypothetical protein